MKKLKMFSLMAALIISLASCKGDPTTSVSELPYDEKITLEGLVANRATSIISTSDFQNKIADRESFAILIGNPTCSSCSTFKNELLIPFISSKEIIIYEIYYYNLEFEGAPSVKVTPTFMIYKNGNVVSKVNASDHANIFNDADKLEEYIMSYTKLPNIYSISEARLRVWKNENKATHGTFVLYIGWKYCGDCQTLQSRVLDNYFENENANKKIYYLESDEYRSLKPSSMPIDPGEEATDAEKEQYEKDLLNWNRWISFATEFDFVAYRDGKVPTIQYYENGIMQDWLVYNNDVITDGVVAESFFDELEGRSMTVEELLNYHDIKTIEFLNNH